MTRDTETLFYNVRMIIDTFVESEPRAWLISKVNRISPNGICRVTLTQDTYNQHTDYIEHDENGNIIGMWADWFSSVVEPEEVIHDQPILSSSISCSGKKQIRIGGSAKTLTVTFYDQEGKEADYQSGEWSYTIDDADAETLLAVTPVEDGKIKLKFEGDDSYIGKILKVTFTSGDVMSSLDIEILPL